MYAIRSYYVLGLANVPQQILVDRRRIRIGTVGLEPPRFGAVAIGAREFLIAYNVNLNSRDKRLPHEISYNFV